jgi:hypothetical protein
VRISPVKTFGQSPAQWVGAAVLMAYGILARSRRHLDAAPARHCLTWPAAAGTATESQNFGLGALLQPPVTLGAPFRVAGDMLTGGGASCRLVRSAALA